MAKKPRKNVYTHEIELKDLKIKNDSRDIFRNRLEKIPYRGYKVEDLSDGRQIVITKPGGKKVYGHPKKEDFIVFIYEPIDKTLWSISHKQILFDLEEKSLVDKSKTLEIIECLENVFNGGEPDSVLKDKDFSILPGESVELLLKAYKWIWGQEDVNYPQGEGREMSMEGIIALKDKLSQ